MYNADGKSIVKHKIKPIGVGSYGSVFLYNDNGNKFAIKNITYEIQKDN